MKAKTYVRDERYWESVRLYIIQMANGWTRGSEAQTLLQAAMNYGWKETLMSYAPASEHIAPRDCAGVVIRNLLLSE